MDSTLRGTVNVARVFIPKRSCRRSIRPHCGMTMGSWRTLQYVTSLYTSILIVDVLNFVQPFTAHFPRADINELVSGDLLHQVIKGTFKDHLVTWIGEYLTLTHGESDGKKLLDEIDRRYVTRSHTKHFT